MRNTEQCDNDTIRISDRVVLRRRGKQGIWTAEFNDHGCHRRRSLRTRRKDLALQRGAELAARIGRGEYESATKTTIAEAAGAYLAFLATQGRARRTLTRYRGELSTFEAFAEARAGKRLNEVTLQLLDRYRAHRLADHDAATVYHETVVIKQMFKWSKRRNLIASNPIADYELSKPRPKERPGPTLEQVHQILDQCTTRRRAEIGMLAFTGMRSGELQALRRGDVDLRAGWIRIARQVEGPTKTEGSVRSVPMHRVLRRLLQAVAAGGHELFFTAEASSRYPEGGRPINTKRLNEYFKAAARRAGIEGFTVHSLRHFFETFTINAGVPADMVYRWMGHRDGSVSARYYHVHNEVSKQFMEGVPFDGPQSNLPDGTRNGRRHRGDQK